MKYIIITLIKLYKRFISPFFPSVCIFHPTCSQYSVEALKKYGIFKGTVLSIWRILRCNPFSEGGYDPVHYKIEDKHGKK